MKLILLLILVSCSTLKKTVIYSSLSGAALGGVGGYSLSPDNESRAANAAIFGVVGAGVAALAGYSLYKDDPRNMKLKHMLEKPKRDGEIELDLEGININANLEQSEFYKSPSKDLPEKLRGKIKEQFIIKYQSKERYVNQGDKTYYIPSFEIYEHAYENLGEQDE